MSSDIRVSRHRIRAREIMRTGRYAPANDITFNVQTSGYRGHHVIFTTGRPRTYMWCGDVNVG